MKYRSIEEQIWRNNVKSIILLLLFPAITLGATWLIIALFHYDDLKWGYYHRINEIFFECAPWVLLVVALWLLFAWVGNVYIIRAATHSQKLTREDCPRIYDIMERLCTKACMPMPHVEIVNDLNLNAYACGMSKRNYTIAVTSGLLKALDDDELAGVLGHELTHIRNHDTQLNIIGIVFTGMMSSTVFVAGLMLAATLFTSGLRTAKSVVGLAITVIFSVVSFVVMICALIALLCTQLTHLALSREREYMADAGSAELTGKPLALAQALLKISYRTGLTSVKHDDICQLFIVRHRKTYLSRIGNWLGDLFSTHPSIEKRIERLKQYQVKS